jgi:branched-chain amino acid transport system permease protein
MTQLLSRHKQLIGITIALILVCFIPVIFKSPYYMDLFIIVLVNAMLAIAFLLALRPGLINMSIPAFWGIGGYVSTVLVMNFGLSFWISLPLTLIISGIIALGLGYLLIGSGSSGFTFVMLTNVIGMLFAVLVGNIAYLGGYNGISNIPPPDAIHIPFLPVIEFTSKVEFFYLALVLFIVVLLVSYSFYRAWTGRAWTAVGLSPRLAESIGINLFKYKMMALVVCSCICALVGVFYAHYEAFIIPDTFNMWQNIYVQIYAILGGIGYAVLGPVLGAVVMTWFPELMRVASLIAPIITGVVLILLILFLPRGLLGLLEYRIIVARKLANFGRMIVSALTGRRLSDGRGVDKR